MKRFLIVMGALAVLFFTIAGGALGYVGYHAYTTADENKKAAVNAVRILSEDWVPHGKQDVLAAGLVQSAQTPSGKAALLHMARLGKLVDVRKVSQTGYHMSTDEGTRATIEFEAKFTHGESKVRVTLKKVGDVMKMYGVNTSEIKFHRSKKIANT